MGKNLERKGAKYLSIYISVKVEGAVQFELQGFADTYTKAYGACLHDMSIPRKELCAALLLPIEQPPPVFQKYDSFRKPQRVIAWVLHYLNNLRRKATERVQKKSLSISELRPLLLVIIRIVHHIELGDEIQRIHSKGPCNRIGSLNPIYSDNG